MIELAEPLRPWFRVFAPLEPLKAHVNEGKVKLSMVAIWEYRLESVTPLGATYRFVG